MSRLAEVYKLARLQMRWADMSPQVSATGTVSSLRIYPTFRPGKKASGSSSGCAVATSSGPAFVGAEAKVSTRRLDTIPEMSY